jgi:hypothetical protein
MTLFERYHQLRPPFPSIHVVRPYLKYEQRQQNGRRYRDRYDKNVPVDFLKIMAFASAEGKTGGLMRSPIK